MAQQQSELINTVLLQNVYIRDADNNPISSQYVLYANGFGQGYWSNAVLPENLSTLSTALGSTNIYIQQLSSGQAAVNASTISTTDVLQSTVSTAFNYSISTTNALFIAVDSFYQSSINIMNSTLLAISTYSTFFTEIDAVQSSLDASASSFSTLLNSSLSTLYSTITLETGNKLLITSNALTISLNTYMSTVSSIYATNSSISSLQGNTSNAIISTGSNLTAFISSVNSSLSSYITANNASTLSTFTSVFSTLNLQSTQISSLQGLSTLLSSISYGWTTSSISTSQGIQDLNLAFSTNLLQSQISSNSTNTGNLTSTFQQFSTTTLSSLSSLTKRVSTISDSLSSLWSSFTLLSMSSILSSIYTSFVNLEIYSANLVTGVSTSVSTSINDILSTSLAYNQSIANAFFASNVSSVYASTLSTVIPSTMLFVSSMISTLYSSLYYDLNSTLQNTVVSSLTSTTFAYLSTITPGITSNVNSTFVTQQILLLSNTSSNAAMDFSTYRNFLVNVNTLQNGNIYRLSYQSNAISSLNYNRGVITIDISTVGSFYSTNSSLLVLETNHYGYPTTVSETYIPYISNADYTLQYEYTILNQIIYTNLLGVYPRLNVAAMNYSTTTAPVLSNGSANSNFVWRNTSLFVSWTPYSFFPFSTLGGPAINPQVQINYNVNNTTVQTYGPYSFSQSTATIQLPMISSTTSPFVSTSISAYVIGKQATGVTRSFVTILPAFNTVLLSSSSAAIRIGGNRLVGLVDGGSNTLSSYSIIVSTGIAANSNINYSGTLYTVSTLFYGNTNTNFIGPSSVAVALISSFSAVTPVNAFSSVTYTNNTSNVSSIAPSTNAAFMRVIGIVNSGATAYSRILSLTASTTTTFAL